MKHFTFYIIISLLLPMVVAAQENLPKEGCYKNLRELRDNKPSDKLELNMVKPENSNNHEYYFYSNNNLNTSNGILKKYTAISISGNLYINCERLAVGSGFALVLDYGKYILFQATIVQITGDNATNISVKKDTLTGQYTSYNNNPNGRHHLMYALEVATGKKTPLTFGGMLQILSPYPDLQLEYVRATEMDENETIINFVKKVNKIAEENTLSGKINK